MRYKGHTLEAVYLPGADFKMENGAAQPRRPRPKDIDHVRVTPDDGRGRFNCLSFKEAKAEINAAAAHAPAPVKIRDYVRPGYRIEVGCTRRGRPGYRWVQGWQVFNPNTGRWTVEMRWRDALNVVRQIKTVAT